MKKRTMTIVRGFCMKMLIGNLSKNMQEKNKLMLKYSYWKFFIFFFRSDRNDFGPMKYVFQ